MNPEIQEKALYLGSILMIFDICFERTYIMKTCVDLFSTLALIVHN